MRNRLALLIILMISFTAVSTSITFYILSPKPSQAYMALAIYSQSGLQGYVIPRTNSTIGPQQRLNWTLAVTNRMGSSQFVRVIARISNSTQASPNSTSSSAGSEIADLNHFVAKADIEYINFTWTLQNVRQIGGTKGPTYFLNLTINGEPTVSPEVGALSGQGFRWIFELWTYDLSSNNFEYGYGPQSSATGTWVQIWFNVHA